eukprot:c18064_g1_i1 orf=134-496(+)
MGGEYNLYVLGALLIPIQMLLGYTAKVVSNLLLSASSSSKIQNLNDLLVCMYDLFQKYWLQRANDENLHFLKGPLKSLHAAVMLGDTSSHLNYLSPDHHFYSMALDSASLINSGVLCTQN